MEAHALFVPQASRNTTANATILVQQAHIPILQQPAPVVPAIVIPVAMPAHVQYVVLVDIIFIMPHALGLVLQRLFLMD